MNEAADDRYPAFRDVLKQLIADKRVLLNKGTLVLPTASSGRKNAGNKSAAPAQSARASRPKAAGGQSLGDQSSGDQSTAPKAAAPKPNGPKPSEVVGTYRQNRKGFGFVIPLDPNGGEDLYIGERENAPGAITGDIVKATVISRNMRDGKEMINGRIAEVLERKHTRFVGSLAKKDGQWCVLPDGNNLIEPIYTPDAATKYIKEGTKVVVEVTEFATIDLAATGVISEVLGEEGDKDVDLKTVIVAYGLPGEFPQEVKDQASEALAKFKATKDFGNRYDMRNEVVCTIDPDDAKDYDDAISLTKTEDGYWELGVHIADVSHFVPVGSALDLEAYERGNSTYFPGKVIPMLPEVLSNGICSLMEGVPRLCKSAFIVLDERAKPIRTRFSNTIINSAKRLRYKEAQDLIDGKEEIYHTDGPKKRSDYSDEVLGLLADMNTLSKQIQKRRQAAGQLSLDLPKMELVLDENGKVVDAVPEDESFTHTLIEMFMVEANEAVARLLDSINVPFLRRTHPEPDEKGSARLKHFAGVVGHPLPEVVDRHAMQALLAKVKGRPEAFSINLAVLRSLSRAEYSPKIVGHFALASLHYGHFTSPIRRYADLTIHRLMDAFFAAIKADFTDGPVAKPKGKIVLEGVPTLDEVTQTGRHISYTERRSEDAERELRQVKLLELMQNHIGEQFTGTVAGVTNFGIFVQLQTYMVEGLIRYTELMDDWWDVDEKSGMIRGQRTGQQIRIGDVAKVTIMNVDLPRRELMLRVDEILSRGRNSVPAKKGKDGRPLTSTGEERPAARGKPAFKEGAVKRSQRSKARGKGKEPRRQPKKK
ncbi:MAG TPA: ribonuclease R [Tepidisphaeraceae bacterium]